MYTQIALAACDRLVLPVTADNSSRRGIQNALSLIYGMKLPSEIYAKHNFHTRMKSASIPSPKVHLVAKNRLTQYVRTAKGYAAVLDGIESDLKAVHKTNPDYFSFSKIRDGMLEIRDFQTAGVVTLARNRPFSTMKAEAASVQTRRGLRVNAEQLGQNAAIFEVLAKKLW